MIFKSFKYRLNPTDAQAEQMRRTFGCKRFVFNNLLNQQQTRYESGEGHLTYFQCNNLLVDWKKQEDRDFLAEVDSQALQQAAKDLHESYSNFFKSCSGKRKGKKCGHPKYKSKYARQSYRTPNNNDTIKITDNSIRLPRLGYVSAIIDRSIEGRIKSATVSMDRDGKYYVSVLAEVEQRLKPMTGMEVGIDLGIKDLFVTSDGNRFSNSKDLIRMTKTKHRIKILQKQLAKKVSGGNNREKTRMKLASAFKRLTNQRNNYYHEISTWLVDTYDAIYMEDLNVAGMMKNRRLSRAIRESAWSTLTDMIEYKCSWYGKTFHRINRFYPSTKTCSCCDYKIESLSLSVREWTCPQCGSHHDRDNNAAINVLRQGQRDYYDTSLVRREAGNIVVVPTTLMKLSAKIERSDRLKSVARGMELVY
jgi:putative transposase